MKKEEIKYIIQMILICLVWLIAFAGTGVFWFLVFKALIKFIWG